MPDCWMKLHNAWAALRIPVAVTCAYAPPFTPVKAVPFEGATPEAFPVVDEELFLLVTPVNINRRRISLTLDCST